MPITRTRIPPKTPDLDIIMNPASLLGLNPDASMLTMHEAEIA